MNMVVLKSSYMGGSIHETFDNINGALAEAKSALRNGSSIPIAIYVADTGDVLLDYTAIMKAYKQ